MKATNINPKRELIQSEDVNGDKLRIYDENHEILTESEVRSTSDWIELSYEGLHFVSAPDYKSPIMITWDSLVKFVNKPELAQEVEIE